MKPYPLKSDDRHVQEQPEDEFWVKENAPPVRIALSILAALKTRPEVKFAAVGPHAVNQLLKGVAIAREDYRHANGEDTDIAIIPWFSTIESNDLYSNENSSHTRIVCVIIEVPIK